MCHRPTTARALLVAAAALVATVLVATSPSSAETLCTLDQITGGGIGNSFDVDLDATGDTLVFSSSINPFGTNSDFEIEVFRYDTTSGALEQVTASTASSLQASVSGDGNRIAFQSTGNLVGPNADGNGEIFRYDVDSDTFTQLTNTTGGDPANLDPAISGDGSRVAFTSNRNPLGTNPDGNREVFWSTAAGTLTQVTATSSNGAFHPAFDDSGTRLTFSGSFDPVGGNADHTAEVFSHAVGGSTTQLTDSDTGIIAPAPAITSDGAEVVFDLDADLTDGNADGEAEIFTTLDGTAFDQITSTGDPSFEPDVDAEGDRIVFRSAGDHAGDNGDGNGEIFLYEAATDSFLQLTESAGGGPAPSSVPAISGDGTRIAFISHLDHLGEGTDGFAQVFLASCSSPAQAFTDVPTTHPFFDEISWMASAGISTGFQPGPTYKPDASVTRAAMSAFMYRLAGQPTFDDPVTPTFADVPTSHPFFSEIEWMAFEGITTGFPGGLYKPADAVTRQSMSAFMYRLAGSPAFTPPGSPSFGDVPASHPFFTEVEWMVDEEITTGFPGGLFKPAQDVTRQAMSAFMYRLADGPGVDLES
jgi:Tol biopolymer transport system component